jgi:hypothetical protein
MDGGRGGGVSVGSGGRGGISDKSPLLLDSVIWDILVVIYVNI